MNITFLENDSRCVWLENKVMKGLYPKVMEDAQNPKAKKKYIIVDWISNDNGNVGVDLKWFNTLGIPAVQSYKDLPKSEDYAVINTGYDSIVEQEKILKENGVEIIDEPCPFIRRLRGYFEHADEKVQYIFLCEQNHIVMKNFKSIFPEDTIFVQMENYQQRIKSQSSGKPILFIPYVTFLPKQVAEIANFIKNEYPSQPYEVANTLCLWIKSKASPIVEINKIPDNKASSYDAALLVTGPATKNKSLLSLHETIKDRGIPIITIATIRDFIRYEKKHPEANVLLVRSPIPNNTEKEIEAYLKRGLFGLTISKISNNRIIRGSGIGAYIRIKYTLNLVKNKFTDMRP